MREVRGYLKYGAAENDSIWETERVGWNVEM
jgi:hypothetical protein